MCEFDPQRIGLTSAGYMLLLLLHHHQQFELIHAWINSNCSADNHSQRDFTVLQNSESMVVVLVDVMAPVSVHGHDHRKFHGHVYDGEHTT